VGTRNVALHPSSVSALDADELAGDETHAKLYLDLLD
jgi:hypothetical protein